MPGTMSHGLWLNSRAGSLTLGQCLVGLYEVEHGHKPLGLTACRVNLVEALVIQRRLLGDPAVHYPEVRENGLKIIEQPFGVQADRPLGYSADRDVRIEAQTVEEAQRHCSRRPQDGVRNPLVRCPVSAA